MGPLLKATSTHDEAKSKHGRCKDATNPGAGKSTSSSMAGERDVAACTWAGSAKNAAELGGEPGLGVSCHRGRLPAGA